MCNCVRAVMSLLGWCGPAYSVSRVSGDDSGVGHACTVLPYCDLCAPDFGDAAAYGLVVLVVKDDGVAGADIQAAVALVPVGVAGSGVLLPHMIGQLLLVAEGPAYRSAVSIDVRLDGVEKSSESAARDV